MELDKEKLAQSIIESFEKAGVPCFGFDGWTKEMYIFQLAKSKIPDLAEEIIKKYNTI